MRTLIGCIGVCAVVLLVAGLNTAQASTLATTNQALNDGSGPDAGKWRGSQNYVGVAPFGPGTLNAVVEFAVFDKGDFQNFLNENGIVYVDPAPGELIYAYQIVNVALGTSSVTNFSVGLQSDESPGLTGATFIPSIANHGAYPLPPTQDPAVPGGGPGGGNSQAAWPFGAGLLPGGISAIMYYSSPQFPELGFSTVNAGLAGQFIAYSLPNPVPEPATALLMTACVALFANGRCRVVRG